MPDHLLKARKAQVKMFESVAVLIVFFVLLAFGIVIYAYFQKDAAKIKYEEAAQERTARIARIALSLPELQCSKREPIEHCIDRLKVDAFWLESNKDDFAKAKYYDLLGDSRIYLSEIFPTEDIPCSADAACSSAGKKCISGSCAKVIYDRFDPSKSKIHVWSPVAVFYPVDDVNNYALLLVDVNE